MCSSDPVKVAFKGYGQADGAIPPNDGDGSQGQLCCGENEIVIEQLCSGAREKVVPAELAQLSCSVKFGTWLKSLGPNGLVKPLCGLKEIDKPESGVPDTAMLVKVMV